MVHSDLPPGEKWRQFELRAMGLRDFARLRRDAPLNPFDLARYANLFVVDIDQIKGLSSQGRELLLGSASEEWSGGACSKPLPDGRRIVVLNPNHGPARTNATLMEEICHVFLGHKPNRLAVIADEAEGQTLARDYRKMDEEAAYAIGAAALVPFAALRRAILEGKSAADVARHFRVSRDLIEYRLKVTRLWRIYKSDSGPV
ncbi:MAG: ImmA/IrrE family metallo-endopeptidase [Pyrinomonadaceae bacterium]|nr:ImmA/IrrE family metallo-endopeptidase [Pyrinomonadaceae bacterium]